MEVELKDPRTTGMSRDEDPLSRRDEESGVDDAELHRNARTVSFDISSARTAAGAGHPPHPDHAPVHPTAVCHSLRASMSRDGERSVIKEPYLKDHVDLATGARTMRCQSIRKVSAQQQLPAKHTWADGVSEVPVLGTVVNALTKNNPFDGPDDAPIPQYRITSRMQSADDDVVVKLVQWWHHQHELGMEYLNKYLHWMFRATFIEVTIASFVAFMAWITVFAILVFWIDRYQPECIAGVGRGDDNQGHLYFGDAWQLSWTTLSTVGYGIISPGLPSTTDNQSHCTGINILMAFESFVGVLFGGVTGAIVFAKVARIQSFAPVMFSDPIVVRYGTGCIQRAKDYHSSEHGKDDDNDEELPCPILEFRLINTFWNQSGGEIMDASVNLVVSRLETPDDLDRKIAKTSKQKGKSKRELVAKPNNKNATATKPTNRVSLVAPPPGTSGTFFQKVSQAMIASEIKAANAHMPKTTNESQQAPYNRAAAAAARQREEDEQAAAQEQEEHERLQEAVGDLLLATAVSQSTSVKPACTTVDEGADDDRLAPRRIFLRLEVETDSHPFFKRTWNIRHVCNEHSPLLSRRVRRMISQNNGFWPSKLNHPKAVREAINFHEIIVSFSGTANVSGSSVYSQKVYEYVDMTVGYTFANVLAKDKDGKLIVDADLLNDVKEQNGGGAEHIGNKDAPNFEGYTLPPTLDNPMGMNNLEELASQILMTSAASMMSTTMSSSSSSDGDIMLADQEEEDHVGDEKKEEMC